MSAAPSLSRILAARIAAEGPMPVAAWMAACNAHYYATRDPFGAAGDFVTAPEVSQMFGELVGLCLADCWLRAGRPADVAWVELGPGRGTLSRDALRAASRAGLAPPVHLVETSPVLKAAQARLLPDAVWHETVDTLSADRPLLIVANEFFDALPLRQWVRAGGAWVERHVGWDGSDFMPLDPADRSEGLTDSSLLSRDEAGVEVDPRLRGDDGEEMVSPAPAPNRHPRAGGDPPGHEGQPRGKQDDTRPAPQALPDEAPEGAILEACPAGLAIMEALCRRLAAQGGAMLAIDYGHARTAVGETLQAVSAHAYASPWDRPGEQDLTAHVDFAALAAAAEAAGAATHGPVEQGQFLITLGLAQRAAALTRAAPDQAEILTAAYRRLSHPDAMGRLFKVLAVTGRDWPAPAGV